MTFEDKLIRLSARLASNSGEDEETGLCNLRQFLRYLARELARSQRTEEPLRIAALEHRSLTDIADIARAIEGALRADDVIARIGQQTFAILRCDYQDDETSIADGLRDLFGDASNFAVGERIVDPKNVISFAAQPLLHDALLALEQAKSQEGQAHCMWQGDQTVVH